VKKQKLNKTSLEVKIKMSETNFADFEPKGKNDRLVMHILYAMHSFAWASGYALAVIALIINYLKRGDETDPLYEQHHAYMISTFWWTLLWFVVTSPLYLLFIIPGMIASGIVGLWYLYRCIKGWLRFNSNKMP
jgi:uncharacterized membrane protein